MQTEKTYPFLKFNLLAERDIGSIIYRLYENKIFHVIIKEGEKVTMEMVKDGYAFLDLNGKGRFYNIYEFKSFSDIEPEVRNWSASNEDNGYTFLDAIVINNFAQKIIADFYLKVNKPKQTTKIFNSIDKAVDWVVSQMK